MTGVSVLGMGHGAWGMGHGAEGTYLHPLTSSSLHLFTSSPKMSKGSPFLKNKYAFNIRRFREGRNFDPLYSPTPLQSPD